MTKYNLQESGPRLQETHSLYTGETEGVEMVEWLCLLEGDELY